MSALRGCAALVGLAVVACSRAPAPEHRDDTGSAPAQRPPAPSPPPAAPTAPTVPGPAPAAPAPGPAASPSPAAPTPAAFDAKLLDAALAARKVKPAAVVKRVTTASSGWAVVGTRPDPMDKPTEYLVLRVRAADTAELRIAPPPARQRPSFDGVESLELRDLDGDGQDEAILTAHWERTVQEAFPRQCPDCFQRTDEDATQIYVIGGKAALRIAASHAVSYKSTSLSMPEENTMPVPTDEEVTYTASVAGRPPVLTVRRTRNEVSRTRRVKGALDPAGDPLLGGDRELPVALE